MGFSALDIQFAWECLEDFKIFSFIFTAKYGQFLKNKPPTTSLRKKLAVMAPFENQRFFELRYLWIKMCISPRNTKIFKILREPQQRVLFVGSFQDANFFRNWTQLAFRKKQIVYKTSRHSLDSTHRKQKKLISAEFSYFRIILMQNPQMRHYLFCPFFCRILVISRKLKIFLGFTQTSLSK